jgi:hypothetical protein
MYARGWIVKKKGWPAPARDFQAFLAADAQE